MASIPLSADMAPNLRPLNILRDLPAVADLIEICFSGTMDSSGRQYVTDMRKPGGDNSFIKWANRAFESTSLPLSGYVWEENNRIIGNASVIPYLRNKKRVYLIANIAVDPGYRRKGIGRALTRRALDHARAKGVDEIWLHVRDDNSAAIKLYESLGFVERARRTTWQGHTDINLPNISSEFMVTSRKAEHSHTQLEWLIGIYPELIAWHRNWNFDILQPSLWNWLYLLFMDVDVRHWMAIKKDVLQAALTWLPDKNEDALFAAVAERSNPDALTALLLQARRELSRSHSTITFEFPAGKFDASILSAGFKQLRTLIWMQATF